jgi:hypothetical protein
VTQLIPSTLTFNYGTTPTAPAYGEFFIEYLGLKPITSGGVELYIEGGNLHNGYTLIAGAPCAAVVDGALTSGSYYGFMNRQVGPVPQEITAAFRLLPVVGIVQAADFLEWSIMGRIQAGSLADDGTKDVRHEAVTCYQFVMRRSLATYVFAVRKIVAGVVTVIGIPMFVPIAGTSPFFTRVIALGMTISGATSPVTITTTLTMLDPGSGAPVFSTPMITVVDSSSPILGSGAFGGRIGFSMAGPRTSVAGKCVDVCNHFQLKSNGTLIFRDEWLRSNLQSLGVTEVDFNGKQGRYLQGRFSRDQFGYFVGGGSGNPLLMRRDLSAERASVDLSPIGSGDLAAALIDHRPPDSQAVQHRQVTITIQSSTHTTLGAGIILYAAQQLATTSTSGILGFTNLYGYSVVCMHTTAGNVYSVSLYRHTLGVNVLIARYSETAPGTPIFPLGSNFILDVEAYPADGMGGFPGAAAVIAVEIDGDLVPLEVEGGGAGVTADSDGIITDGSSGKLPGGFGEGLMVVGDNHSDVVTFDAWAQGTLHEDDGEVDPPENLSTIPVLGEGEPDGSLDDVLLPGWSISCDGDPAITSVQYDSGHRYTAARFVHHETLAVFARRQWAFQKDTVTQDEHDELEEFFADHNGGEIPFFFTDPAGFFTEPVHFISGLLVRRKRAPNTYAVSFTLEEIIPDE